MRKSIRSNRNTIALQLVLLVSLLVITVSYTYAWEALNNSIQSQNQQMELAAVEGVSIHEYHIYKWNGSNDRGEEVSNNVEGSDLYEKAVSLTEYDTVFTDRNVDTPLIIKIIVKEAVVGTVHIKVTCPEENHLTSDNKLKQYFSNICSVKVVPGNSTMNAKTDANDIFVSANALVESATAYSFATVTNATTGATSKNEVMSIDVPITSQNVDSDGILVLYLQMGYDSSLVDAYITTNGIQISESAGAGEGMDILNFPSDVSHISFVYTED